MLRRPLAFAPLAALVVACAAKDGGGADTDVTDTEVAGDTDTVSGDTDTTAADTDVTDTDPDPVGIVATAGVRAFADGTYALSCRAYQAPRPPHVYTGDVGDGVYTVDPDGAGAGAAFDVYCDMTTNGGGWTLVAQATPVTDGAASLCATGAVATLDLDRTDVAGPAKLADDVIDALWSGGTHEVLMLGELGVAVNAPVDGWDTSCVLDFAATQHWDVSTIAWATDTTTVTCAGGNRTISQSYAEADTCGFGVLNTDGSYLIFSYGPGYTLGCSGANAGRSWPGSSGNNGCNTSKTFVR